MVTGCNHVALQLGFLIRSMMAKNVIHIGLVTCCPNLEISVFTMIPHSVFASAPVSPSVWLVHSVFHGTLVHNIAGKHLAVKRNISFESSKTYHEHIPIPLVQQVANIILLIGMIQEVQDALIEQFGVR
jgi:hypothetical protein